MNENYNDFFNIFKKIVEETLGYAGKILNKEDIKLLKYNLYTLDGLYIKYKYAADVNLWRSGLFVGHGIGGHNYNKYLNYLDYSLFNNYYLRVCYCYLEFLSTKKPFKYAYTISKNENKYIIDIHKFIEKGDILDYVVDKNERRSFNYNRYYQISGELLSIEEYLDIFKDNFKDDWKYYYDMFLSEYPVLEYLSKTEKKKCIIF